MPPVVLIPGIAGNTMEAKVFLFIYFNSSSINLKLFIGIVIKNMIGFLYIFNLNKYIINLISLKLLPFSVDCWVDNIKMKWDEKSGQMINNDGV